MFLSPNYNLHARYLYLNHIRTTLLLTDRITYKLLKEVICVSVTLNLYTLKGCTMTPRNRIPTSADNLQLAG